MQYLPRGKGAASLLKQALESGHFRPWSQRQRRGSYQPGPTAQVMTPKTPKG
jgi:hypothetical protein